MENYRFIILAAVTLFLGTFIMINSHPEHRKSLSTISSDSMNRVTRDLVKDKAEQTHELKIRVNFLDLIPVILANVTIVDDITGTVVAANDGRLEIPYGFYYFSAEEIFNLPAGRYRVIVRSLNTQERFINIDSDMSLTFTEIISLDCMITLILVIGFITSYIAFLLIARKT